MFRWLACQFIKGYKEATSPSRGQGELPMKEIPEMEKKALNRPVSDLARTGEKEILDGNAVRSALREKRRQRVVDVQQLFRERGQRGGADRAAEDHPTARSVGGDAAITGALRPWIDAENRHASDASISFSSMSKLDQTCCTSSWSSSASIIRTICWAGLPSSFT